MTSMHGRWSKSVALPVGKQWGAGEGGVAACMSWDAGPRPPPAPLVRVQGPYSNRHTRGRYTEPEVTFDPSMAGVASSRQTGQLELGPAGDLYRDYEGALADSYAREMDGRRRPGSGYRSLTERVPTPVVMHRETIGHGTPYLEDHVTQVVKQQNYGHEERFGYTTTAVCARPPRAPKPRTKSAGVRSQRRVEVMGTSRAYGRTPDLKVTRPNSSHANYGRGKTVSFRPGTSSTIGYGGYDYVTPRPHYDDDLVNEHDLNDYYYGTGQGSHFRSWQDANKVETPDLRQYSKQPLYRSGSCDNLWRMNKFTKNAKPRVVTRWEDEGVRSHHDGGRESPSKVNLALDCPEDADVNVNVTVNPARGSFTPARMRHVPVQRPPSKSMAWY